jgi:LuxR family maltose regulon positive regulatory protein
MRSQFAFNEIREKDLRFDFNETTAFLNGIIGLDLTDSEIALLESRIEGWIAGLQMASISMKGREDHSSFLHFFSSSNRYIMDYLTEEVLAQQEKEIQDFLLSTACLDRFNAELCDHLTGQTHSQETILELVNKNLFIVPLDERNRWFRYHHLFSDYLRNEFHSRDPEKFQRANLKASLWWEQAGSLSEAISYAVAARDFERADQLISDNIISWISQGEVGGLEQWLGALPESYIRNNHWLALGRIWLAVQAGQFQTVSDLIVGFEERLLQSGEEADSRLYGHFNILKSYALFLMWNSEQVPVQQAIDTANQAFAFLDPELDCSEIVLAKTIIAGAYHGLGELEKAEQAFEEGIRYSKSAGEQLGLINLLGEYADLLLTQGRLHKAYEISQEALGIYKGRGEGLQPQYVGYTHTRLSMIYHQWNQLGDALVHARKGLEISEAWGQLDIIVIGYYQLAKVLGSLGRSEEAIDAITKAKQLAVNMPAAYRSMVEAWYVRIMLACGDHAAGARWVRDRNLESPERPLRPLWKSMVLVRVLLVQRKYPEAVDLASILIDLAESSGADGYLITLLILRSRGHTALKANQRALQDLDKALDIAAAENNLQDFVDDGGEAIRSLLEIHIAADGSSSFAAEVMNAFEHRQAKEGASLAEQLIEPLSERELEVLALLATERSPKEIASELFISLSTVNTHIRNIYSKLDVKRRYEAVRLAKELKLILD